VGQVSDLPIDQLAVDLAIATESIPEPYPGLAGYLKSLAVTPVARGKAA